MAKDRVHALGTAIRLKYPELMRLAESSPLYSEAKEKNQAFIRKTQATVIKSQDELERACVQVRNVLTGFLANEALFEVWLKELRAQLNGSNEPLQETLRDETARRP